MMRVMKLMMMLTGDGENHNSFCISFTLSNCLVIVNYEDDDHNDGDGDDDGDDDEQYLLHFLSR